METYKQTSTEPIPTGEVTVKMLFDADEPKPGTGGNVTLLANDKCRRGPAWTTPCPSRFSTYAGMDIGRDNGLSSTSTTRTRRRTPSPAP